MASHDTPALPDVVISGALALALADAVEYASHRTTEAETAARAELAGAGEALARAMAETDGVV